MDRKVQEDIIIRYLRKYETYKQALKNLKEAEEDLIEAGMGINYSKDNSGPTNKFNSGVENAVIVLENKNIQDRQKSLRKRINTVDRALEVLGDTERKVIEEIFMHGKYYYQFCYQLGLSERTAKRIKKSAMDKMLTVIYGVE